MRQLFGGADRLPLDELYRLLVFPMDSVRYFEFDFVWRSVAEHRIDTYLDVSSPRLFPLMLIRNRPGLRATLLNPDRQDLPFTVRLASAMRIDDRCDFRDDLIGATQLPPQSMDVVTSISVLEHIPEDRAAIGSMWSLVKPGGKLILTVPCAAAASEEYVDDNKYGLLEPVDGFVFWQRYYDPQLLNERIFSITGQPARSVVYGEKVAGSYAKNVRDKMQKAARYPLWREPYMMAREYRYFDSIHSLPGMGVVGLEFRKPCAPAAQSPQPSISRGPR